MTETKTPSYRDYDSADDNVKELYREQRKNQTVSYVRKMLGKYCWEDDGPDMEVTLSLWGAITALGDLVDQSDPDTSLPNIQHAFQTAEGIRLAGKPEWMQLIGLIHDLGKILYLKGKSIDGTSVEKQWGVVGDTFIVGHPLSEQLIFPEFNEEFPQDELENYKMGCGFDACVFSFGHDEYLWRVLQHNAQIGHINLSGMPLEALYIIRYHSFHAWHEENGYQELADDWDRLMLPTLQEFSKFDLYTKSDSDTLDINAIRPYYEYLFRKYFKCTGDTPLRW